MLMDFLTGLNWIDILMAIIFARIVYIGIKNGFVTEFFKFCGALSSVFICLHYYNVLAVLLMPQMTVMKPTAVKILVFGFLWIFVTFVFKLVREGLMVLFSVEPHPAINKWIGALAAVLRGLIICSLTFFILLLSLNPAILKLSEKSWCRYVVAYLAPHIYSGYYWGAVVKFFPAEPINEDAFAVPGLIEKKRK